MKFHISTPLLSSYRFIKFDPRRALSCFSFVLLCLATGLVQGQTYPSAGTGIAGTAHDPNQGVSGGQANVCSVCHSPHDAADVAVPQWSHPAKIAYTLYEASRQSDNSGPQPGPITKVCLSCHDNTLAKPMSAGHLWGVTYDAALASRDGSLANPELQTTTIGDYQSKTGSVSAMMLYSGRVECTSCHDVHNNYTVGNSSKGLIKASMVGSGLCRKCHTK